MTDIVGLLYDKNDESTLIPEVEVSEIEGYKAAGVIAGGMLPKIEGMADAIYQGVHEAVIIDGRVPALDPARDVQRQRRRHDVLPERKPVNGFPRGAAPAGACRSATAEGGS